MSLKGKKIILGICGSIAAYKTAFLTRLLIKAGAEVQILMTPSATAFIGPLTLSTLSKRPVFTDVSSGDSWNNHVDLGIWADAMIIAPATATTLAKLVIGLADNVIVATYLSAKCPVFFAPAMDLDMWKHPASQNNVKTLQSFGNHLIPVEHGELASGLVGDGRMAEPENIIQFLEAYFKKKLDLKGQKAMVTAGPTFEPIDPVRFIGNRSTGKMGIAIAEELAERGARVQLILGPTTERPQNPTIECILVKTAEEMYQAAHTAFDNTEITVLAAAVADYRPKDVFTQKIKKKEGDFSIHLERTTDIAASLGKIKRKDQTIVGFALETQNELAHAKRKLEKKNFDFIVLNSLNDKGAGFAHDTNKITLVFSNKTKIFELKTKKEVAQDIVDAIVEIKEYHMKKYFLLFITIIFCKLVSAQEIEFTININTPKLQTTDPKVFESLKEGMSNFLNNQKWTSDVFDPKERIKCNIQMTIKDELSANTFSADFAIQAVRPVYGSSYETPMLSHVDKDLTFVYEQFQPLEYTKNSFSDNLTSFLSFYVYIILGMDYDSYSLYGGELYYQTANDILTTIPPSAASAFPGWRSLDGNRNRYWIIENLLSPKVRDYRQAMYDYHRQSLDLMASDTKTGRAIMLKALETISKVNRSYPNSMIIQMFTNAKSTEIIEIFKKGTSEEKRSVRTIMSKIDASNASKYRNQIGR